MFAGSLGAPDDARGSAGGVEAGVGTVALVGGAELAMSLGALLWRVRSSTPEAEMVGGAGEDSPLSDRPLLVESRRVEGRKMLTRRPEKDILAVHSMN